MRPLNALIPVFALIVSGAPVLAATTTTTTTVATAAPHTMIAQPIHPVQMLVCPPGGAGSAVAIAGLPNFQFDSISFDNGMSSAATTRSSDISERKGRGSVTVVKKLDAASPKLFQLLSNHTTIPAVQITMRKAGGSYLVMTLAQATIHGITQINPNMGSGAQESVVFEYQTISECSGPSQNK